MAQTLNLRYLDYVHEYNVQQPNGKDIFGRNLGGPLLQTQPVVPVNPTGNIAANITEASTVAIVPEAPTPPTDWNIPTPTASNLVPTPAADPIEWGKFKAIASNLEPSVANEWNTPTPKLNPRNLPLIEQTTDYNNPNAV
uniref:hypothetical protein n=1 Tax=Elmerina hispida TaxID=1245649 RepID=UPI0030018885|nr:hypothetical protein [Elmerina hispida]